MKFHEITDWFLDRVAQTTLFEMAKDRSEAINKVEGVANPLIYHLIYLYLYPHSTTINHWKSEIDNKFLDPIDDLYLKPTGKRKLTGNDYYRLLFKDPLEGDMIQLSSRVRKAIHKEGPPQVDVDYFHLKEILEKLLHKVSFDMANNKFKTINDYLGDFGEP